MFYRNTPSAAPEGDVVLGAPLTTAQADGNIKGLSDRLVTVEGEVEAGWTGLDITAPFSITGNNLYAKLTNGQTYGPYPIPTVSWNLTNPTSGAWLPSHQYYSFDVFNYRSTLYLVQWAHTSASTFDPDANDGHGHNYYAVVLSMPGSTVLPPGGTQDQVLMKNSGTDYDVDWGNVLPSGGTTGQILAKHSNTDFDVVWLTAATGVTIGTTAIPGGGTSTSLAGLVSLGLTTGGNLNFNNDTILSRAGVANLRVGAADGPAPVPQTLSVQDVASGTADTDGVDFTINGSQGTGLGFGGSIVFRTATPAIASGTNQNALVEAGRIDGVTGATQFRREVRESSTSTVSLTTVQSGIQFDNTGAIAGINFVLPTPSPGMIFGFCVVAPYPVTVTAPSGCVVAVGSSISAAGGHATASAQYSYLVVEAVSATAWAAKSATGNWTVT